ncbi:putative tubulin-tyrosine ligase/Tubulin polyglutamylase, leucine-rich repeat domain, L [Medicago truncatula]|uniref:Putative tubulin-tyrosine ligase/Tubulin polyglutamylase, leucine-rich repeat domain, L n=1 Tax=Medicago truncatula TaxID=3880 RepID=A0A072V887_MEDTR|nr:tubulin--tyrosine ligase-like protein 12 [Medicago truncatula]KEH37583.1 tubulin-tyrosine ligase family protein [Medicago truncatula]RHN73634.1 putative tubulin-tyrosine ligase/Tubulin polyglutamylase, leucine-rich repeat domain, L [Medicago truncatula]
MVAMATTTKKRIETYEDFTKVHGILLAASGLPESLHRRLFHKLSTETFDGGEHFQIEPCEENRMRRLVLTSDSMAKDSNVFLVDHAWTFRLSDAYKQLREVPGLAERMGSLMCVDIDLDGEIEVNGVDDEVSREEVSVVEMLESEVREVKEKGDGTLRWLELDGLDIDDDTFLSLDLPARFPNLVALSLYGNKLTRPELIIQEVIKFKHLKGLWLNNNPVLQNCDGDLAGIILKELPELEIYNSTFTSNFGEWALGFCAEIYGKDNPSNADQADSPLLSVSNLDLSNRNIHNLINKDFSPVCLPSLSYLNIRGNPLEQSSVTDLLDLLRRFSCLCSLEVDIPGPLGGSAVEILESLPNISELNGICASKILESGKHVIDSVLLPRLPEWTPDEPIHDRIISAMWQYLMTYRLADEEKLDETSVWYVMDEFGSALRHSDEPNFRVAPFLFMPEGNLASAVSFSILWPTRNVWKGDECTRDFLLGIGEDKQRSARLTAWFNTPENYFIQEYEKYDQRLQSTSLIPPTVQSSESRSIRPHDVRPLRVYTDIPHVEEYLTHPEFAIIKDPKDADIIWTCVQVDEELKKATGITDQQYINQFPFEACLVMKHHLAETIQKAHGSPQWLQPTYNLETHLSQLIGDYYVRKREGLDNLWILKPWNMARTIDTTVTDNLPAIIRLMETGPKICQKYIEQPALFQGKKFDLRYVVLVRSMHPLEIFLSDCFWVRIANNQYSLAKSSLFEYETHFTVMNYRGRINHKNIKDFVREFEEEHQVKWLDIHARVRTMIRSVFEAAAVAHPEMHSPTSRAIYGVDVMLDSSFQPKLLEVTYCPDCTRACKYDMDIVVGEGGIAKGCDFFNNVFKCLFLNEISQVSRL